MNKQIALQMIDAAAEMLQEDIDKVVNLYNQVFSGTWSDQHDSGFVRMITLGAVGILTGLGFTALSTIIICSI